MAHTCTPAPIITDKRSGWEGDLKTSLCNCFQPVSSCISSDVFSYKNQFFIKI